MNIPYFLEKPFSLLTSKRAPKNERIPARYKFIGSHGSMGYQYGRIYAATVESDKNNRRVWFIPYKSEMRPVLYDNLQLLKMNWIRI